MDDDDLLDPELVALEWAMAAVIGTVCGLGLAYWVPKLLRWLA